MWLAVASGRLLATCPANAGETGETPVDYTELLSHAFVLGEMIKHSALADAYVYLKQQLQRDEAASRLKRQLAEAKEKFAECERFGRFHPDYHESLERVYAIQAELDQLESVSRFKQVERELDELLHEVAFAIASSVSPSIKVPGPEADMEKGCGSGGKCSCGGGGCG